MTTDNVMPIVLLTILNNQQKKKELKQCHGYYIASGINIMMAMVNIFDNEKYYNTKYGNKVVNDFLTEMSLYIFKCLSQNIELLEGNVHNDKIIKIYHHLINYLQGKMQKIMQKTDITASLNIKKTDIINYHFTDKTGWEPAYKALKRIDKDVLIEYIDQKYGCVCECAFIMGWMIGLGEEKMIINLEKMGCCLGIMIKITNDFINLERDIKYANKHSFNYIINYGIHEAFVLFMDNKLKLIEYCISMNLFNNTMKEIVDHIEKKIDDCLKKTDVDLKSIYSSYSKKCTTVAKDSDKSDMDE